MANFTKIGALWPGRNCIASGFIDWPKTKIIIKENENPKGNNSPKYFLMAITEEDEQGSRGGGGQGGGSQGGGGFQGGGSPQGGGDQGNFGGGGGGGQGGGWA